MTVDTETVEAPQPAAARGFFVRRVQAAGQFEVFFVAAVGTILIVRAALALTGWPQLGGGKIHFAHLLWGGLGMLIGIVLFIISFAINVTADLFLNRGKKR